MRPSLEAISDDARVDRPPTEMVLVGVGTSLGRAIAVGLAMAGRSIVVIDDDLTLADEVVEGLRSIGASIRVDVSSESLGTSHRRRSIIDTRTVALDHEVGIVELATASAAMLPPGSSYVRAYRPTSDGIPVAAFDSCVDVAEERSVGVLLVGVGDDVTSTDLRFVLESVFLASSEGGASTVRLELGSRRASASG